MIIHLVRHGPTSVTDGDYYSARLSENGAADARKLAASGTLPRPDVLLSSPFPRALETAALLGEPFGLKPEVDTSFAEWHLQEMNLSDFEYEREEAAGWSDFTLVVAGGESLAELRSRALKGLGTVAERDWHIVLIVSHATLLTLLCAEIAGRQPLRRDLKAMPHLAHAVVEAKGGRFKLKHDILAARAV